MNLTRKQMINLPINSDFSTKCTDGPWSKSFVDADTILLGDFNVAPYEHDVWSHKALLKVVSHTPIETEKLTAMLKDGAWIDVLRRYTPMEQKLYTWWSYRARDWNNADKGRRLDHIWASRSLDPFLASIEILRDARGWEGPSDHVPVSVNLQFKSVQQLTTG